MQCRIFRNQEYENIASEKILSLVKYHPYRHSRNPYFDENSGLILDVKNQYPRGIKHFKNLIQPLLLDIEDFVICVIPTHEVGVAPSGIRTIARKLCTHPIIDGTDVIIRISEIEKKATGGSRDLKFEIESLGIRNEEIVNGRHVLLLDDVTTTGTSLEAGRYILKKAGATMVAALTLGKTQLE